MAENEKSERDTKFQGFARLLWIQLRAEMMFGTKRTLAEQGAAMERIIAQRAYDLVEHVFNSCDDLAKRLCIDPQLYCDIEDVPDLTEWPPS